MLSEDLLKGINQEFNLMKKELNFKATLDELDDIFFIEDYILRVGFISKSLSRIICGAIADTFNLWVGQLHSWIMPNTSSIIGISESDIFDEKEKKDMQHIMKVFRAFISENVVIGLTKDKEREGKYIDNALLLWNENKSTLITYAKKVNDYWNRQRNQ
jgi:hypothetical protein